MLNPRKDQLAAETMDRWYDFVQYAELTRSGEIVRRDMAAAGHELTTIYGWASMAPEDDVIAEIVRLECLVFSGYDPYFDGDEPPEL